tara:strand:- start:585 stop:785 length:201 start_codon:yes stop_codon:yes gene_type:complete
LLNFVGFVSVWFSLFLTFTFDFQWRVVAAFYGSVDWLHNWNSMLTTFCDPAELEERFVTICEFSWA